eukprot:4631676-Amphidinium_carterae.1
MESSNSGSCNGGRFAKQIRLRKANSTPQRPGCTTGREGTRHCRGLRWWWYSNVHCLLAKMPQRMWAYSPQLLNRVHTPIGMSQVDGT